jgi:DNA-binding Lrp family transcriptional regulator
MNLKINKLLFSLSKNSRNSTKKISKEIGSSQQSCSYLINSLSEKNLIRGYTSIIDVAKLGYINVMVCFDLIMFDSLKIKKMIKELSENPNIILIEENKEGIDLIIEYCCHNLSAFNKVNMEIVNLFKDIIKLKFIMPVIVKHEFLRNYLVPKIFEQKDIITCGDRDVLILSEEEKKVLEYFAKDPMDSYIKIYSETGITPKKISLIRKSLEHKNIIKGYSCILNHSELNILRNYIFIKFIDVDLNTIKRFIEFSKNNKNIIQAVKIIGDYHVFVVIEELKSIDILREIRSNYDVGEYLVVESSYIHKKRYLPI